MSILNIEHIYFAYENKNVLEDISFTINEGDYLGIIGENGSGKTTLLELLLRLIKPSAGKIIFGENLKQSDIGYLPQQRNVRKDFPASSEEVILSGLLSSTGGKFFYTKKDICIVVEYAELLHIEHLLKSPYRELSGGMMQRVLLARSLAAAKRLLVLDEPVTGLDNDSAKELYNIAKELNTKKGLTVIMVSHDIESVLKESNMILQLDVKQVYFGESAKFRG